MSTTQVTDVGVLEYEIVEEAWNEYQLADKTLLRARLILTRLGKPPPNSPIKPYLTAAQTIFTVVAPLSARSTPGSTLPPEETQITEERIKNGVLVPVKIIASSEPWNVYRVVENGELFQAKLVVSAVYRVKDRYDQVGEPHYIIQSSPMLTPLTKGTTQLRRSDMTGL